MTATTIPRTDTEMAAIVTLGFMLAQSNCVVEAAYYMACYGVPLKVTKRVLLTPYRRPM